MRSGPKIVIVDYGVGNLHSLFRAITHFNARVSISEDADEIKQADGVILPGVGSFEAGMRGLRLRGLTEVVQEMAAKNKPMLGVCLGAQLMLTEGHEFGIFKGLEIFKGQVVQFPILDTGEKIPQIGWNTIFSSEVKRWKGTILDSICEGDQVYFVHSYILKPENKEEIFSLTTYGNCTFCSTIRKGNVYGCQFHPEKSGKVGLKIIQNFINII